MCGGFGGSRRPPRWAKAHPTHPAWQWASEPKPTTAVSSAKESQSARQRNRRVGLGPPSMWPRLSSPNCLDIFFVNQSRVEHGSSLDISAQASFHGLVSVGRDERRDCPPHHFSPGQRHADVASVVLTLSSRSERASGFHEEFWVSHLERPSIRADTQVEHLMLHAPQGVQGSTVGGGPIYRIGVGHPGWARTRSHRLFESTMLRALLRALSSSRQDVRLAG